MTLQDLVQQIRAVDLRPIRVVSIPDDDDRLTFAGDLSEYLEAVKDIEGKAVFFSTVTLSERHFMAGADDEDEDDESGELVDLCSVLPKLSKLKEKIGVVGLFDLLVRTSTGELAFTVAEDWWIRFVELHSEARQRLDQQRDEQIAERGAEREKQTQKVLQNLRDLINDKQFASLSTQRAMREYALEKLPELQEVEEQDLKREIQNLSARIQAKGLGRK